VNSNLEAQFVAATKQIDRANVTLTQALDSSSDQPLPQISAEVAQYKKALDTFEFNVHVLQWPSALQVPSQDLNLRLETYVSFLQSISAVNASTSRAWLAQLHAIGVNTQTADNLLRKDIGLSPTSSYP
jgi:hypothetical protein